MMQGKGYIGKGGRFGSRLGLHYESEEMAATTHTGRMNYGSLFPPLDYADVDEERPDGVHSGRWCLVLLLAFI